MQNGHFKIVISNESDKVHTSSNAYRVWCDKKIYKKDTF